MTPKPSLKQLEYIIAVARIGSFRGAAEDLNISQPTLTSQIARAEEALGVQLFERSRNGAQLTPTGREFEPHARRVLDAVDDLMQLAGDAGSNDHATYRLGVKTTVGPYLLPHILPDLRSSYSELRFFVREDSPRGLEEGLARGDYDLIVTSLPINSSEFSYEPLLREELLLAAPADHEFAGRSRWLAKHLAGQQVLTTVEGHLFTRQVEAVCTRLGAEVLRDYEGTSLDALRVMVVMGMGLTFLPALYVESEISGKPGIVVRRLEDESIARMHVLAWRSASPARTFYRRLAIELRRIIGLRLGHAVQVIESGSSEAL
ncbi:MAG: hydrogen peroxide-inducible genes activator [Pseudomonadota bacterium]